MKTIFSVVVCMFLAYGAFAGGPEEPVEPVEPVYPDQPVEPVDRLSCLAGNTINGTGNVTARNCSASDDTCQTKIEVRDGTKRVWRECKPLAVCENNAKNNPTECYSKEALDKGLRICFSCCGEDECNDSEDIPSQNSRRRR